MGKLYQLGWNRETSRPKTGRFLFFAVVGPERLFETALVRR